VGTDELLDGVLPDIGDTHAKASAFWILLACSSVIAAAGVLADSTAVVIGAMVIAPLGTPIYGIAAALATGIRLRPAFMRVLGGVALAVAIGAVVELATIERFAVTSNPQVLARTSPTLIDLLVAFATGIAGSMALVRTDISPALPGVAIAISLVPPLTVVGITAASGELALAGGAILLFATNMLAIVLAGLLVFAGARLAAPFSDDLVRSRHSRVALWLGATLVVALLAVGTARAALLLREESQVRDAAEQFDASTDAWQLTSVTRESNIITVTFVGWERSSAKDRCRFTGARAHRSYRCRSHRRVRTRRAADIVMLDATLHVDHSCELNGLVM
jgi:uncharacterized hydrophobic protein (TIGR00271 family)